MAQIVVRDTSYGKHMSVSREGPDLLLQDIHPTDDVQYFRTPRRAVAQALTQGGELRPGMGTVASMEVKSGFCWLRPQGSADPRATRCIRIEALAEALNRLQ